MEKLILLTKDDALRAELSAVLPKNCKVLVNSPAGKGEFVFFDIDTIKPGLIRELSEDNFVVAVTRQKWTAPVMEAATFGAYEVIHRPLAKGTVQSILDELGAFREELKNHVALSGLPPTPTCAIVGQSPIIMDVCKKLARLSQVDTPVLITGETGTGKELIAESIAQLSSRFGKPFVVVNCAAVPENLLESELFGFEKGSFTGAFASKEGILKIADEGSVFFDEVGELPLALQGKLLRFLQTQTFYPIGSTRELQVNVRVISATNRDLGAMVRAGKFRDDLYHRLSVTSIHIPPLRERKKDILPLVTFFVGKYKHTAPRPIKGVTKAFLRKLDSHDWPGNIRELENSIRSALALSKTHYLTTYELRELGDDLPAGRGPSHGDSFSSVIVPYLKEKIENKEKNIYDMVHNEVDRTVLDYVMSYTKDNQSEAAKLLGINRLTLRKKLGAR
ncbi:MAG: sigma-54-dependent Fis family transcriptional regulator [Nitrospirae bacterium]|nr:sigma-54-dependent Fis family transcriptional regulator [Nitrospirota bacterium]